MVLIAASILYYLVRELQTQPERGTALIVSNQFVNSRSNRFTVNTNITLLTERMPFKQIVEDNVKRMRILNVSFESINLRQKKHCLILLHWELC